MSPRILHRGAISHRPWWLIPIRGIARLSASIESKSSLLHRRRVRSRHPHGVLRIGCSRLPCADACGGPAKVRVRNSMLSPTAPLATVASAYRAAARNFSNGLARNGANRTSGEEGEGARVTGWSRRESSRPSRRWRIPHATAIRNITLSASRGHPLTTLVLSQSICAGEWPASDRGACARIVPALAPAKPRSVRCWTRGRGDRLFEVPAVGRRFQGARLLVEANRMTRPKTAVPLHRAYRWTRGEDSLARTSTAPLHPRNPFRAFLTLARPGPERWDIAPDSLFTRRSSSSG